MGTKHIYGTLKEKDITFDGTTGHSHDGSTGGAKVSHANLLNLVADDHTQYLKADGTRALTGDLSAGTNKITSVGSPALVGDAATKGYVDSVVQGVKWQDPVLDRNLSTPPGLPTEGDRYIIAAAGTQAVTGVVQGTKTFTVNGDQSAAILAGDKILITQSTGNNGWYTVVSSTFVTDHTDIVVSEAIPSAIVDGNLKWATTTGGWDDFGPHRIVEYQSSAWTDTTSTIEEGVATYVQDENALYVFSDTYLWVRFGSTILHSQLQGLTNDDHTQYHNDARGDIRYYQKVEFLQTSAGVGDAGKPVKLDAAGNIDATMIDDADIDHGSIGGLIDDDHTQYHNDARGDARYYQKTEFLQSSAGVGDAGKPVKLDVDGTIDATMINDVDIDHGSIGGLVDDDHTQYHNDVRGDARYYQKAEFLQTSAGVGDAAKPVKLDVDGNIDASMINDADISHNLVSGITANDHHNQIHTLDGADHSVAGLTSGEFLKATGATTFGFGELGSKVVISNGRTIAQCITALAGPGTILLNNDDTTTTSVSQADICIIGMGLPTISAGLDVSGGNFHAYNCQFVVTSAATYAIQISANQINLQGCIIENNIADGNPAINFNGTGSGHHTKLMECFIRKPSGSGGTAVNMINSSYNSIIGCYIHGVERAVYMSGSSGCVVQGCYIFGAGSLTDTVRLTATSDRNLISGNAIYNNNASATVDIIVAESGCTYNIIVGNSIRCLSGATATGVSFESGSSNNIAIGNYGSGLDTEFADAGTNNRTGALVYGKGVSGDILYFANAGTVLTRLPLGSANQVLKVNTGGTGIEWGAETKNQDGWVDHKHVEFAGSADIELPETLVEEGTGPSSGYGLSAKIQAEITAVAAMSKAYFFFVVPDDFNSWPTNNLPVSIWCDEVTTTTIEIAAYDDAGNTILIPTTFNKGVTPNTWVTNNFTLSSNPSPGARLAVRVQIGKAGGYIPAGNAFRVFAPKPAYRRYA